jgi:hypothetical protein
METNPKTGHQIVLVDPKKDLMRGKRFDDVDQEADIHCGLIGKCFCGMDEGVEHHHRFVEETLK